MDRWICDNEPCAEFPIYTRANAGEVMPDPMTPLTNSLGLMGAGDPGWRDAYVNLGTFHRHELPPESDGPCTIGCFGGYLFLNMSLTRIYGVRCPGMTPELVDLQYFGTMPGIPPYRPRPTDEDPARTEELARWLAAIMSAEDLPELRELRDQIDALCAQRPDLAALSERELVAYARSMLPHYRRVFAKHIEVSGASGIGIGTVAGVCQALGQPELLVRLIGAAGDVDSAVPANSLWELSRLAASSPCLTAAFDEGVAGLLDRLSSGAAAGEADATKFLEAFGEFQARFGTRGPNEWELRATTWAIAPELPLAAVERMRLAPGSEAPALKLARLAADRNAAATEVRAMLAGDAQALGHFEAGLRTALLYSAGRERTKTINIKLVDEQRSALRELGRRMVERGHLGSVEPIFMLMDGELDDFVASPTAYSSTVAERERQYLTLFHLEPPFIIDGTVPPLPSWPRRDAAGGLGVATPGTVLTGIAGSPGVATGRARVVTHPSDPTALGPGDVLVAPITDPAWTPLFVPAAAVVVDVGAQISHAVIVSRELGIPCVVSVIGGTRRIPDGALVRVDGSAGTVTIVA